MDKNHTFTVPPTGGKVVINYQTNVDCEVIIPEEAQDWITIVPATRGLVAYSTSLDITANNSGKERSCVVKVVSQDYNELFVEYTITQKTKCSLYYTSSNGKIVTPNNKSSFDATILSNTYKDGVGVIEFSAPITTIGLQAFYNCKNLTSVTIPNSVTEIGSSAFNNCSSLSSVTIGDSVTMIDWYAFQDCSSLTSVTIPDSVKELGQSAFSGCTGELIIDNQTLVGKDYTSTNYPKHDGGWLYGNKFTKLTIGKNVTTIGNYAFYGCRSLTSVAIGDSVAKIGECAFYDCYNLTSVTIPDSVTKIDEYAFYGCSSLSSVTIPDSVWSIEDKAFFDSGLKSVCCKAITPPSLGSYVFFRTGESGGSSKVKIYCKIYVPMESVSKYKSVIRWSEYASDIVGQNF